MGSNREMILEFVRSNSPCTAAQVCAHGFDVTAATVATHLKALTDAGAILCAKGDKVPGRKGRPPHTYFNVD